MRLHGGQGSHAARERQAAFVELYENHYAQVLAYARRRADDDVARDVTAETFTVAWRRLDLALERGLPWLYRTASLVLANWQRGERRGHALAARVSALPETRDAVGAGSDLAQRQAERSALVAALRTLPELDRELLLLTVWEQLDVASAAAAAGCTAGAAHVRLHRARRRLREMLADPSLTEVTP